MKIMTITSIREVGSNGILRTAIANGCDLKIDKEIEDLINRETSYMMTVENVNLLNLFRLTQSYGPDLRILKTNEVSNVDEELQYIYPGTGKVEGSDETFNISEAVQYTIDTFLGLCKQMYVDNDIIKDNIADMCVPMILRTYTIEIPLRFDDLMESMDAGDLKMVFCKEYPNTLSLLREESQTFKDIAVKLPVLTKMVSYPDKYGKLISGIYYNQLKHSIGDGIGKVGLCSVSRLNPATRNKETFSLYNTTPDIAKEQLSSLAKLNTPLEFQFMIKLPIQYMQMLENSYRQELLQGSYRSSVKQIIDDSIDMNLFKDSGYNTRVTEAIEKLQSMIGILISNEDVDPNVSSIYSIIPSIYSTNMMITFKYHMKSEYIQHSDPVIKDMWDMIIKLADGVIADLDKLK